MPYHQRTTRAHAGETFEDVLNWPGYVAIAVAMGMLGMALTAAAHGFTASALIAGGGCIAAFVIGIATVTIEYRRLKAREGRLLSDPLGH